MSRTVIARGCYLRCPLDYKVKRSIQIGLKSARKTGTRNVLEKLKKRRRVLGKQTKMV